MSAPAPYRVLARKYRPADFGALIGQEAMVRTLSNAIAQGRIAQAFVLTGVRGVGKTTTARIVARALNCIGPDGQGGPTVTPCGVCENCRAIAEDRHLDVIEMDAASNNGVDDIRVLTDGARFAPVQGRYRVYILDEAHMLSKAAFNALLKTLEEPPDHAKFIFCTTEAEKLPLTILSRCQRFDLKRVEAAELVRHFQRIAAEEGAQVEDEALALIARAAEGSVRDGLSLLDQAIAHTAGQVGAAQVREMLGLADRSRVVELFEQLLRGDAAGALQNFGAQYADGADPEAVLRDLLEFTSFVTRIRHLPEAADDVAATPVEREKGREFAAKLGVPSLARAWQILLKGLGEVRIAPRPFAAAEMVLIRLAYAADLPSPADLIARLQQGGAAAAPAGPARPGPAPSPASVASGGPTMAAVARPLPASAPAPAAAPSAVRSPASAALTDFRALANLFRDRQEMSLYAALYRHIHPVLFEPGRMIVRPTERAPASLLGDVGRKLSEWTGERWMIVAAQDAPGAPTLAQEDEAAKAQAHASAEQDPVVQAIMKAFPGAVLENVVELAPPEDQMTGGADEDPGGEEA